MDSKTKEILQKFSTQKVDLTLEKFQMTTKEIEKEVQRLEQDAMVLKKEVTQLLNRYYSTEAKVETNKKQAKEYTNLLNKLGMPKGNTIGLFDKAVNKFEGLNTATKMKGFINNF